MVSEMVRDPETTRWGGDVDESGEFKEAKVILLYPFL